MQFDRLKRREFITLLGGAAAWPAAARAQQAGMPVVGYLDPRSFDSSRDSQNAFRQGLKDSGFIDGENVSIEYRWAEYQSDRLPGLAAELVRRRVAVIVTIGGQGPALAARAASTTIPIVFLIDEDLVKPACRQRLHTVKPQIGQIERLDKHIDRANRIAIFNPVTKAFRQQRRLPAIRPLNEAPHLIPPQIAQESYRENQIQQHVFTQPGSQAAVRAMHSLSLLHPPKADVERTFDDAASCQYRRGQDGRTNERLAHRATPCGGPCQILYPPI